MSNPHPTDARTVSVDHEVIAAIREQSLVTLEANHHYFEEVESFRAPARKALTKIYRDAFATLDAIGWDAAEAPPIPPDAKVDVPLTPGHVEQLRTRRFELGHANIDRVEHSSSWTIADLEPDREAGKALDRLFAEWAPRVRAA